MSPGVAPPKKEPQEGQNMQGTEMWTGGGKGKAWKCLLLSGAQPLSWVDLLYPLTWCTDGRSPSLPWAHRMIHICSSSLESPVTVIHRICNSATTLLFHRPTLGKVNDHQQCNASKVEPFSLSS